MWIVVAEPKPTAFRVVKFSQETIKAREKVVYKIVFKTEELGTSFSSTGSSSCELSVRFSSEDEAGASFNKILEAIDCGKQVAYIDGAANEDY